MEPTHIESTPRAENAPLGGKHLTFKMGEEEFAIAINRVQEIIGLQTVTHVPLMEQHVRGILNLRGRVIPIIDLRARFNLPSVEDTPRTCIIVVEVGAQERNNRLGIVVDEVAEVLEIPEQSIQLDIGSVHGLHSECLAGVGVVEDEVKMLLDIDQVITPGEVARITRMADHTQDAPAS